MILEKNWKEIKDKVVEPLWYGKFKRLYEAVKLDHDDFLSLSGIELTKAFKNFDSKKASYITYAGDVLNKKAITEIRNAKRNKRKALHTSVSLDAPIDDGTENVKGKNISYNDNNTEISELSEVRTGNFISSLNNNQLRVLILSLLEFKQSEIAETLDMSEKTVASISNSLKNAGLTRILYRRNFK